MVIAQQHALILTTTPGRSAIPPYRDRGRRPGSGRALPYPHHGFTLIETIIIIAIIALLLGLMMPALASTKAAARSVQCASHLRQMTLAAQQYANLFEQWPAAIRYEQIDGSFHQIAWDWQTTMAGELVQPGPLWMFTDNPGRVQQCPEYPGTTNFIGDPYTGYNYNTSYLGAEASFPDTGWDGMRRGVPPHACHRGSTCAMFGDGGRRGGTNKFMRAPLNHEGTSLSLIYSGGQAFRHQRGTNVGYIDGHVGALAQPREGDMATAEMLDQHMDWPKNGFLTDDDRAYDPR